jgi:hypothetical protein
MKHPAPYIRRKLFALLHGNVSYNGSAVPVYDTEGDHVPLKIILGAYADASSPNKQGFSATASQVIEVVSEQPTAAKKVVDEVGELVMNVIKNQPGDFNLDGEDFSIIVQRPSINHLTENASEGRKIVRLILTYNLNIGHS